MFNSKKPKINFRKLSFVLIVLLLVSFVSLAQADSQPARPDRPLPASIAANQLDSPISMENATAFVMKNKIRKKEDGVSREVVGFIELPEAGAKAKTIHFRPALAV